MSTAVTRMTCTAALGLLAALVLAGCVGDGSTSDGADSEGPSSVEHSAQQLAPDDVASMSCSEFMGLDDSDKVVLDAYHGWPDDLVAMLQTSGYAAASEAVEAGCANGDIASVHAALEAAVAPAVSTAYLGEDESIVDRGPRVLITSVPGGTYNLYGPDGGAMPGFVASEENRGVNEVLSSHVVAQRSPITSPAMAIVTIEQTPNDGLSAGTRVLAVRTYDAHGAQLTETVTPARDDFDDGYIQEVGLLGGSVFVMGDGIQADRDDYGTVLQSVDTATGDVRWTAPCGDGYSSTAPMYAGEGTVAIGCGTEGVRGFSVETGGVVWEFMGGTTQNFAYDASAPGVVGVSQYAGADITIDLINGVKLDDDGSTLVVGDPISGIQAYGQLEVYDPASSSNVLSIDPETIDGLGEFLPLSAFDGRLTFLANDGLSVVSLATGEADPSSPAKSSEQQSYDTVIADAGTGWALVGSVKSTWDPSSWGSDSVPLTVHTVVWAADGGELGWEDIGDPQATG